MVLRIHYIARLGASDAILFRCPSASFGNKLYVWIKSLEKMDQPESASNAYVRKDGNKQT